MKIAPRAFLLILLLAPVVRAQTTLTVNSQTSATNGLTVPVEQGTTIVVTIDDASQPRASYGLFGALMDNGMNTGWFLRNQGAIDPFPLVTGIATSLLEAQLAGLSVSFSPSNPGSPVYRLNSSGSVTLRFTAPLGFTGQIALQAAVQPPGLVFSSFSNAIYLDIVPKVDAARILLSRDVTAGDPDDVEFGVLSFTGNPATGLYVPDPALTSIKVEDIVLGGIQEWQAHDAPGFPLQRDLDSFQDARPTVNFANPEYVRIALPTAAGTDGQLGTSDDIPPRDLLRCYDNVTQEGFFLVINKGDNPNIPGVDFLDVAASRMQDSLDPLLNGWGTVCGVSRDGTVLAAVFQDSAGGMDEIYLIAVDGSTRFLDSAMMPTDVRAITPAVATRTILPGSVRFTSSSVFFVLDDGVDADSDGDSHRLFSAPWTAAAPTSTEVTIPATGGGFTVDHIAPQSLIVARNGNTLVFLGGDVFGTSPVDNVSEGDWYRVQNSSPTTASNFTTLVQGPAVFIPGSTYNGQSGFASLSPDGQLLVFVCENDVENGSSEDEVYAARTNGADANGLLANPVTRNAFIDTGAASSLDNAQDVHAIDNDHVLFFYGVNLSGHTGARSMDLFHYELSSQTFTNVTRTGSTILPITVAGTIYPEGYFAAPGGRYVYFSRGSPTDAALANIVGVDLLQLSAFNVTGGEFGGVAANPTTRRGTHGENYSWQLAFAGGSFPSLVYFATDDTTTNAGYQVWAFDADFPTTALRITTQNTATITVESLTPNPHALGAGFAFALGGVLTSADVLYSDLSTGVQHNLSFSGGLVSPSLGSITFVPPRTADGANTGVPEGIVYGVGTGTAVNPTDADLFYESLDGSATLLGTQIGDTGGTLMGNVLQVYHARVP